MITVLGITGNLVHLLLPLSTPDAHAESFNIKPGAWEMSVTTVTSGMKLSPELSAKMAPQRAHMEQMMKAREGKPHTMTTRSCITQEDLSQDRIIRNGRRRRGHGGAVQVKVLSKSSTKLVMTNYAQALPLRHALLVEAKTP